MNQERNDLTSNYEETKRVMNNAYYDKSIDTALDKIARDKTNTIENNEFVVIKKENNKKPCSKVKIYAARALIFFALTGSCAYIGGTVLEKGWELQEEVNKQVSAPYIERIEEQNLTEKTIEDIYEVTEPQRKQDEILREMMEQGNIDTVQVVEEQDVLKSL